MSRQLIVVESLSDWTGEPGEVVHVDDYLTNREYLRQKHLQVINLCRSYRYQSVGYYCSLLAEARGHRVLPTVGTMLDLSRKALYTLSTEDLDDSIRKSLGKHWAQETVFSLDIFYGQTRFECLSGLARQLFERFPAPLLQARFQRETHWQLESIKPLALRKLDEQQRAACSLAYANYSQRRQRPARERFQARYDLAILHDPQDPQPPSDTKALQRFIKAGRALGIDVELITKRDYGRLAEYDALFIRDTTNINHYTYRFAKKAESEGMVVIDDPKSILLCTNKVYLAELLHTNRVATPRTAIVGKADLKAAEAALGFPMVLKLPDGAFSQGVFKAENMEQLKEISTRLFKHSELLLAQEFLYTEFDWRIGILNRQPIYASQYFMSKKHWQIVQYKEGGGFSAGGFKTWAVGEVPEVVVDTALRAANLIGNGLYGVDLKQSGDEVYVIEVNDNPNIDAGIEDAHIGEPLYTLVMSEFLRRLETRHGR